MADKPDTLSAVQIRQRADAFLTLSWVHKMHTYVRTIEGMTPEDPPPDRPGMTTLNRHREKILTVPQLMARAKDNAARWEPLLGDMLDVARPIKEYAIISIATVQVIDERSKTKLAAAAWAALDLQQRQQVKAEFDEMVQDLITAAESNQRHAQAMKQKILSYRVDIVKDHDESQDIQGKYKDWLAEEDKTVKVWEQQNGLKPGETEMLITSLQKDVDAYNAKWAGLASGATATAGGTVAFGLVVFPPLGAIAGLIAMSAMAAVAEESRKLMDEFQGRLNRVKKYNKVKLFFATMDKNLERIIEVTADAADALDEVAGLWSLITADLKSVLGDTIGVSSLAGSKPWEAPIRFTKRMGVEEAYRELMKHCDVFVQYAYVRQIREIDAGK